MESRLRIAVADDEPDMREYFEKILPRLGHVVVSVAETGRQLVEQCEAMHPDLVITDIKMPEMDGIEAATEIYQRQPVPLILVSAFCDCERIARAEIDHIMAYLVKPIKQADLEPAIALVRARFEQFQDVKREAADLDQAWEDRKFVERAKVVLIQRAGLDEQTAFLRLQQLASNKKLRLAEIARTILLAEQALDPESYLRR